MFKFLATGLVMFPLLDVVPTDAATVAINDRLWYS